MGRHQRGEGGLTGRQRPQQMLGIEARAAVDLNGCSAIGKRAHEIERVGVTHGHHQKPCIPPAEAKFHLGGERQEGACAMGAYGTLRLAGGARRVHQSPGVVRRDRHIRRTVRGLRDQVLIAEKPRRCLAAAEMDHRHIVEGQGRLFQCVLYDQQPRLAVLQNEAHLISDQPEIDRHGDQPGARDGRIDLQPLDAVVGEHGDAVAFPGAEPQKRVGEARRTPIPSLEGHRALQIGSADPIGRHVGGQRYGLAEIDRGHHVRSPLLSIQA